MYGVVAIYSDSPPPLVRSVERSSNYSDVLPIIAIVTADWATNAISNTIRGAYLLQILYGPLCQLPYVSGVCPSAQAAIPGNLAVCASLNHATMSLSSCWRTLSVPSTASFLPAAAAQPVQLATLLCPGRPLFWLACPTLLGRRLAE